ncbi:hypothetical protein AB0L82_36085 [Nocardia sp. NPDC052001]|uniref:hypothetical protein n=1 Tax=Nocardia sp. NPDC052001 TaxID=3154853 RepID=UPI00344A969D
MTRRHTDPHRARRLLGVSMLIVAAATACGTTSGTNTPAAHTQKDFCVPLLDYFRTTFPIDGVTLTYTRGTADTAITQDADGGVACVFSQPAKHITANASLRRTKSDEDHSGLPAYVKEMNLVPLPGHSKEIWISDARAKQSSIHTKGVVELATRSDPWVSGITIVNETDTLAITDAQIATAADLLITTTQDISH